MSDEQKLDEILEIVRFLKDNGVEREEFRSEIGSIRASMVTKDYLDEKLADLRGDLVVLMRKEDGKLKKLMNILFEHHVITENDVREIVKMEPFPELA